MLRGFLKQAFLTGSTLLLATAGAYATPIVVAASGEGFLDSPAGSDGNTATGNYSVGNVGGTLSRDHFDFVIPVGTWASATLDLVEPGGGHSGAATTYSVYSIGAFGTYTFSDIGTGTLYGSIGLSAASTTVHLTLNTAALAAIQAAQGLTFSLAGVDSGEGTAAFDFGFSGPPTGTPATLTLTAAPEPGTIGLLGLGLAGLGGLGFRKRVRG